MFGKIRAVTVIATFIGCGFPVNGFSQHLYNPQVIEHLDDVFEDAKLEWSYANHDIRGGMGTLTNKGLVVISGDSKAIRTIDRNGQTVWEKGMPENEFAIVVKSSHDGRYLCLFSIRFGSEVSDYYQILSSDGQPLWGDNLPGDPGDDFALFFSESGDYSIYRKDHLTVSETESGRILWRLSLPFYNNNMRVHEWGLDRLVFVDHRSVLMVTELASGKTLWKQSPVSWIESDNRGYFVNIVPSRDGSTLVAAMGFGKRYGYREIQGFDQDGVMLWNRRTEGREIPLGITPDNRFLASITTTIDREPPFPVLKLTNMTTGSVVWTIQQVKLLGESAVFMNNRMFFLSSVDGTLVIAIDSTGHLVNQFLLADKDISNYGFRSETQLTSGQNTQKVVFLFRKGYGKQNTFHIESLDP